MPTPPSLYQQVGLSVEARRPLVLGGDSLHEFDNQIISYTHQLSAYGGYDTATIGLVDHTANLENWYEYGLGRHIVVHDHSQNVIWEGFVNQISLNMGSLSKSRGPLLDIANSIKYAYTTVRWNTNPPVGGDERTLDYLDDLTSQGLYGIWREVVSGGEMFDDEAALEQAIYLATHKDPETGESLNFEGGSNPSMTLECLGYFHALDRYDYFYSPITFTNPDGMISADLKIKRVLMADPNLFFSTDYAYITANAAIEVSELEDDNQTASAIVKDITARGDGIGTRWLLGVYKDRTVFYHPAPSRTDIEYQHHITEPSQKVTTLSGNLVRPWNVLPGKWLVVPHYPQDELFIEQVQYTAPFGLSVTGGKGDPIRARVSSMGLSGISA